MRNSYYYRLSNLDDIYREKERLRRKIKRQEKKLSRDWERIEDSFRVVNKVFSVAGNLFSSATLLGSAEVGYKLISHFLKKRKQKNVVPTGNSD
ncbi:MAG: hypothetical protein LBQ60_06285 [Bacteroidales bacterium]|jgi:hypothetical protein|nr:hypothetical protein [Bacteroidales bacterium]